MLQVSQLLPENMAEKLQSIAKKVERNPRCIKVLVNLLQIISEIAKIKPMTGESSTDTIFRWKGGVPWKDFSEKVVLWIIMAQNFTFRLSAMVQVLLDFEQKREFNAAKGSDKDFIFKSCWSNDTVVLDNFEGMPILEFYLTYVEKFVHILRHSDRLSKVDKDPEEFAFLLRQCDAIGMKCEDILGPLIDVEGERRKDLALLSYSFNLDPAMRLEVQYLNT